MTSKNIISQSIAFLEQGLAAEAENLLVPLLKKEPNNFNALQLFGLSKNLQGNPTEALIHLEKALEINPAFPAVRHNIAGVYRSLGNMQKAEHNYRQAIELKPDYAEAYQGLTEIIRFKPNDPILELIKHQLKIVQRPKDAIYLHFAAGKIYDDCGEFANAFKHYSTGNSLSSKSWEKQKHDKHQDSIKNTFNRNYFAKRSRRGYNSSAPIFIIGMPRSGSTLVEQILASHSLVFGAGEINDIPSIADQIGAYSSEKESYPECMKTMPVEAYNGLGLAYLNRVFQMRGDNKSATHSIDKNLYNFNHLGLISDLLPAAHIIHIQRHPLDTCLSCYFQNFSKGLNWSFQVDNIADYYRRYREMMSHWEETLPIKIHNIKYEELINRTEQTCRQLLEYCELELEENCLQFYKNKRKVQTASVWQVRQPIYQRSKGRWLNYKPYIKPLIEGLADYVDEYENSINIGA